MMYPMNSNLENYTKHELRVQHVEELNIEEIRARYLRLLDAIDPETKCVCVDPSEVSAGEACACGYHANRLSWIIHQARIDFPQ